MIKLRYEVRYKNKNGLIRTSQFKGEEEVENFITELKNDSNIEYFSHWIVTI